MKPIHPVDACRRAFSLPLASFSVQVRHPHRLLLTRPPPLSPPPCPDRILTIHPNWRPEQVS